MCNCIIQLGHNSYLYLKWGSHMLVKYVTAKNPLLVPSQRLVKDTTIYFPIWLFTFPQYIQCMIQHHPYIISPPSSHIS